MTARRLSVIALCLCCLTLFSGRSYADSTPSDPIIDTELGSGSYNFNGTVQLRILWSDLNPSLNCTAVKGMDGVDDCTGANGGFVTQVHVVSDGVVGALQDNVLHNFSNQTINDLLFDLSQSQGPLSPTSPFQAAEGSIYSVVTNLTDHSAIYSLGPGQQGICSDSLVTFDGPAPGGSTCPVELGIGIKHFLINENGFLDITLTSNVPIPTPEPASAALLAATLPGIWIARKKWRK